MITGQTAISVLLADHLFDGSTIHTPGVDLVAVTPKASTFKWNAPPPVQQLVWSVVQLRGRYPPPPSLICILVQRSLLIFRINVLCSSQ